MSLTPEIFISYRHDDTAYAGWLSEHLTAHFPNDVFIDFGLEGGEVFERRLRTVAKECHVLVIVISPLWAAKFRKNRAGIFRSESKDWVRLEIETAVKAGCHLLPVLVHGAEMPKEIDLPASLQLLAGRQSMHLNARDGKRDFEKIVKRIKELLKEPKKYPFEEPEDRVPPPVTKQAPPSTPPPPVGRSIADSVRSIIGGAVSIAVIIVVISMCSDPGKARRAFDSAWNKFFPTPTPARLNFNSSPLFTKEPLRPTPTPSPTPWSCPHPVHGNYKIELCWTQLGSLDGFYMETDSITKDQWKEVMGSDPPFSKSPYSHSHYLVRRVKLGDVLIDADQLQCMVAACVSLSAAKQFVTRLNHLDTEYRYRIPNDSEWDAYEKMSGGQGRNWAGFRVAATRRY